MAGLLFVPCLFLASLVEMIPAQATAPALILVGWMMMSTLVEAEEADLAERRAHPRVEPDGPMRPATPGAAAAAPAAEQPAAERLAAEQPAVEGPASGPAPAGQLTAAVRRPGPVRRTAGIDFHDPALGVAAFFTIVGMAFTYSITNGIGFGFISFVVIKLARHEWRDVHPFMWVTSVFFTLYFLVPTLQQHVSWF